MSDAFSEWTALPSVGAVPEGEAVGVEAGGQKLALYRVGGTLFCTDNVCTHAFACLSDGWLEGHVIECPLHAGQFDIRTGCGMGPPIDRDLRTYPVREEGGTVFVGLPNA